MFHSFGVFLEPRIEIENKYLHNIVDVISYVGGLSRIIKIVLFQGLYLYMKAQMKFLMIKRLYFKTIPNFLGTHMTSVSNRYRYVFQKWSTLKINRVVCCKKNKKQAKIEQRFQSDFNLITIVDNIYKIKATLEVLVQENKRIVMQAKRKYF